MVFPFISYLEVSGDLPTKDVTSFVYPHLNSITENNITPLVFLAYLNDFSATLHMTEITKDTIIRVRQKNLTTGLFDQVQQFTWTADKDDSDDLVIEIGRIYGKGVDVKVTMQSDTLEGATRNIRVDLEELVY